MNHLLYAPYRCRDCKHRFFKFSGFLKLSVTATLGFLASVGFLITIYLLSKPDHTIASPPIAHEIKPSRTLILEKAKQGKADDQYAAGLMYMPGGEFSINYKEALKWFDLAAKQGHAGAEFNLGLLYKNGRGVLQDFASAAHWIEKAAHKGYPEAQYQLGTFYKTGEGIQRDLTQAYVWYNLASAQGYEPGISGRETVANLMNAAEVLKAQILSRNFKPTLSNHDEDKTLEVAIENHIEKNIPSISTKQLLQPGSLPQGNASD
ncbi:MAG: tetratricopeptide repeat protein [Candidatus Nitrotoga sp.]